MALACSPAMADLVSSRASLGATDHIDWDQIPLDASFPTAAVVTALGEAASVSSGNSANLWRLDQGGPPNGYWQANFTPGEALVLSFSGVISLSFTDAVAGAGTQFANGARYGAFDATLTAFDASGNLLETHTVAGSTGPGFDGSAVFVGLARAQADISRLEFRVSSPAGSEYPVINRVDILQAAVVPEPGAGLLALLGLPVIAWARSRQRKSW
ncbi:hypothetical protein ASD88_07660 [Pelomonas sp. Root662]|nr:hypothetical protein ASC81_07660 [Pelomonas sp. Root405]KRA73331.1 hypothetical protein ASD88_07660 [Pelomonas sp. Root662]